MSLSSTVLLLLLFCTPQTVTSKIASALMVMDAATSDRAASQQTNRAAVNTRKCGCPLAGGGLDYAFKLRCAQDTAGQDCVGKLLHNVISYETDIRRLILFRLIFRLIFAVKMVS